MHPILLSRELRRVHCFCSFHFVFSTQYAQLDLVRGCLCALPIRSQTTSLRIYLHVFGKLANFLRKRANANVKKHFCFTKTKGGGEKRGACCAIRAGCPGLFCYETSECSFTSITQFLLPCIHTKDSVFTHRLLRKRNLFVTMNVIFRDRVQAQQEHWLFMKPHRWHEFSSKILIYLYFFLLYIQKYFV